MNDANDAANRHRRAWELIPWVLNETAAEDERQLVEAHIRDCTDCRIEYEFQRRIRSGLAHDSEPAADHAPALARLHARLDAAALATDRQRAPRRWLTGAMAAAIVVETLALSVTGTALWAQYHAPVQTPEYRTLTTTAAHMPAAAIRAVFAPDLSLAELQALLQDARLQIVAGPNSAGAFALAPLAPADTATVLAQLRRHPGVRFAEPLTDNAARSP